MGRDIGKNRYVRRFILVACSTRLAQNIAAVPDFRRFRGVYLEFVSTGCKTFFGKYAIMICRSAHMRLTILWFENKLLEVKKVPNGNGHSEPLQNVEKAYNI